ELGGGSLREGVDVHAVGYQHESVPYLERDRGERAPGARTRHAVAAALLEQGAVRGAKDQRAVSREESLREKMQRVPGVRTAVHVAAYRVPGAHHKASQGPVAGADGEGARPLAVEVREAADHPLDVESASLLRGLVQAHAMQPRGRSSASISRRLRSEERRVGEGRGSG